MPKKRGAPKGNLNARKHGFYSLAYTREEQRELSQTVMDHRQNNIKFFKVIISRTAQRIKPSVSNKMSFQENLLALQTVVFAVSRLLSAVNLKRRVQSDKYAEYQKDWAELLKENGSTQEEIDESIYGIIPASKRGGQPGNLNAFKHGFYATHYTAEEISQLENLNEDDVIEEIALLQVLIKRIFIGMKAGIPFPEHLKVVRIISSADACLERLNRERGSQFGGQALADQVMKAIMELDPDEEL